MRLMLLHFTTNPILETYSTK